MIRFRWWALAGVLMLTASVARAQDCSGCSPCASCPQAVKGKCCCPEGTKCDGDCTPDNCTCTKGEPKPAAPCCEVPACSKSCPCEGGKCCCPEASQCGDECCEPAPCPCKNVCSPCCPVSACLHKVCSCVMHACFGKTSQQTADEPCKGVPCTASTCVSEPAACGMVCPCPPPCACPSPCVAYPPMPVAMPSCAIPCAYAETVPENWTVSKCADGISIHGTDVEATCDRVSLGGPEGCVILQGHVKLKCDHNGQHTEVKGDQICVRLSDMAFWVGGATPAPQGPEMMKVWYPAPIAPR